MDEHQACRTESLSAPELSQVARLDAASCRWFCLFARLAFRSVNFQLVIFFPPGNVSLCFLKSSSVHICLWKLTAPPMDGCWRWCWWWWGCLAAAVREWERSTRLFPRRKSHRDTWSCCCFFFLFSFSLTSLFHTMHEEVRMRRWEMLGSSQCVLVERHKGC